MPIMMKKKPEVEDEIPKRMKRVMELHGSWQVSSSYLLLSSI